MLETRLNAASHLWFMIIEIDAHLHRAKRRDHVQLLWLYQTGVLTVQNCLGNRIKHAIQQFARQHADDTPGPALVRCSFWSAAGSDCSSKTAVLR